MVFCVITDENVSDKSTLPECDVAVYGFYGLGEVNYERELRGETEKFEEAARLSKNSACGLVCGCKTVTQIRVGVVHRKTSGVCRYEPRTGLLKLQKRRVFGLLQYKRL